MNAKLNRIHTATTGHAEAILSDSIKPSNEWEAVTWQTSTGATLQPTGSYVWAYDGNIFYSNGTAQYRLIDGVWTPITWTNVTSFYGSEVWRCGSNVFLTLTAYDSNDDLVITGMYRLNWSSGSGSWVSVSTSNCIASKNYALYVWNDDNSNAYFSKTLVGNTGSQKKITTNMFVTKVTMADTPWTLNGSTYSGLNASNIWHDGSDIHHSRKYNNNSYLSKLTGGTGTSWVTDSFSDPFSTTSTYDNCVWTDGTNIYYSYSTNQQLKYNIDSKTWENMTWEGCSVVRGNDVWTDGSEIYYSNGSNQYKMKQIRDTKPCYLKNTSGEWVKQNAYIKNESGIWEQVSYK